MSNSGTVSKTIRMGSLTFSESKTLTSNAVIVQEESVAAGNAGTLTTRTNDTEGSVTASSSSHGITDGDRVDLYWTTGCRRGATVGTVAGAVIPFSGGSGDALPLQDTAITIVEPLMLDVSVEGDYVSAICLYTAARGQFCFNEGASTEHLAKELGDGIVYIWHDEDGSDNPIDGDTVNRIYVSHDETTAQTMRVGIMYDNAS